METFDGRLRSFEKLKSKTSSKSSSSRTWPHPDTFIATPTTLAEAGFFFKPSKDNPDNVQCFICKKELGGWDEDDNPFDIHCKKCPKCPWAIARCSLEFDVDADGNFLITDSSRMPTNKVLEKARADTFGGKKWWPHDGVKNHGATSKKMAKAGFVYTPQAEGDDTATCFYCNLSLSGWDVDDDPADEHMKRVERSAKPCPFFEAIERPKSQASTRSNKSASRKSRVPKYVETPTDGDDETPTVRAPVKKKKNKGNESVSDGPKLLSQPSDAEHSEDLQEDDDISLKVPPAPVVRKSSRKAPPKSKSRSKAGGRIKRHGTVASKEPEESEQEVDAKSTRSRTRSGKGSGKDPGRREKMSEGERDNDKPPSNVDGMITKLYNDFTIDINAAEEAKNKNRNRGRAERGRSTARGRSRSKSRPRSTNASTLVDPQDKPLLRASSRSRISGTTEIEEMETERLLAATPSDMDIEPETRREIKHAKRPFSSAERENYWRQPNPETEDTPRTLDQLAPRPASVASGKRASGIASKQGKTSDKKTVSKTKTKKVDSVSSASVEPAEKEGEEDCNGGAQQLPTGDHRIDVNRNDRQHQELDEGALENPPASTSMSPSDSKTTLSKAAKKGKAAPKSRLDFATKTQPYGPTEALTQFDENERQRQSPAWVMKELDPSDSQFISKQTNQMDVDEERSIQGRSRSQGGKAPGRFMISEPATQPRPVIDVTSNHAPRPVTPKNQIIPSDASKNNTDAADFRNALHIPPSPANVFLPPLANAPILVIATLAEEESAMTVEQWIRHEMAVQYQRLKEDGERRIRAFLDKAEETRRQIEAL